jgi:type IV pilus secretin PilQ/predicted competence protein
MSDKESAMSKAVARPMSFHLRPALTSWLVALAGILAILATPLHAMAASQASAPRLAAVSGRVDGKSTSVVIEVSEPVPYVATQPDPFNVVVELRNVDGSHASNQLARKEFEQISGVAIEQGKADDGATVARIRIGLLRPAKFTVRSSKNVIFVQFEGSGGAPAPAAAETAPSAPRPSAPPAEPEPTSGEAPKSAAPPASAPSPASAAPAVKATPAASAPAPAAQPTPVAASTSKPATALTLIQAKADGGAVRITLTGNGRLVASSVAPVKNPPPRLVLDFANVRQAVPALLSVDQGAVKQIRVATFSQQPLVTRVVLDLTQNAAHRVENDGDALVLIVGDQSATPATRTVESPAPPAPRPVADPKPAAPRPAAAKIELQRPPEPSPEPARAESPRVEAPRPEAPRPEAAAPPAPTAIQTSAAAMGQMISQGRGEKQYSGFPVSFDFTGADLRSVIRTFAEDAGLNIVLDPAVQGSVDVNFRDVPWDQALDLILRSNKLGYTLEGSVVRIAPLTVLAEEEKQHQQLADAQAMSGQLGVLTRALSYAKAEELSDLLLKSTLTTRGQVQVDKRTNTIIIRDLPASLAMAENLLTTLDKPQPQVEIEARIVQTTRESARALGVQWGMNARAQSELGNTLPTTFPAQGSVSGRVGSATQGNVLGPLRSQVPTAINLGAQGATSGIGISMGSLTGAFNLDVALSALEKKGQGRVLSTPRVVMQNNVEAEMYQGIQIPIQTVANNTVTVTFKDAALSLKVTPQITAADTVIMNIALENATPDFSRQVNGIPPIDTQRARTQVLVRDNETTVLGGVVISQSQSTNDKVPFMSRIPLLGWLFKRDTTDDSDRELLIFITPRIVRQ